MGPGGVFYFLRNGSVILDIAHDMEELCPNALMINYTNPMVMICWAVTELTSIRNVGLCHSVQGTAFQLADYMDISRDELRYWTAGINHMAWYLKLEWQGQNVYPRLYEAMGKPEIYDRDPVRFEIMRHFGAFVTESTRHMSEYVPYFRRRPELLERYQQESSLGRDWHAWMERRNQRYLQMVDDVKEKVDIQLTRTHEYCSFILNAIETNAPYSFNGNVRNNGVISNLPANAVVEVPCLVDGTGIHPCYVGALPAELAALNRTNLNVQEVIVEAMKRQDRDLVYRAVQLDPLTAAVCDLDQCWQMVDELFDAHKEYMPF